MPSYLSENKILTHSGVCEAPCGPRCQTNLPPLPPTLCHFSPHVTIHMGTPLGLEDAALIQPQNGFYTCDISLFLFPSVWNDLLLLLRTSILGSPHLKFRPVSLLIH